MKKVHIQQLLRKVILASQYKVKGLGRPVTGLQPCPPPPQAAVLGSGPLQLAFPVTGHHQLGSPGTSHSGGDRLRAGLGRGASSAPQAEPCLVLRDSVGRYVAGTHGRTAEGEVGGLGGGRGSLPLQSSRVMGSPVPRPPTPTALSLGQYPGPCLRRASRHLALGLTSLQLNIACSVLEDSRGSKVKEKAPKWTQAEPSSRWKGQGQTDSRWLRASRP